MIKISRIALGVAIATIMGASVVPAMAAEKQQPSAEIVARSNPAEVILGSWSQQNKKTVMEIRRSGKSYTAIVTQDSSNPAAVNKQLMRALSYDASQQLWSGEVFAAKRGEFVPVTLKMKGAERLIMTAGTGLLSRDITWSRH